jgi:uncharacterized membrane protein YhaH (DUF805 family)
MDLFLTPNGRINQATYWRGAIILFVISAVLAALSAFVSPFIGFAGVLFIWPWIAIHVKRFHDSGKSGWMTLAMVGLAIVASLVLGMFLPMLFGVNQADLQAKMIEQMSAGDPNDAGAAMSAAMDASTQISQAMLLPQIVSTLVTTGIIGVVMGLFKSDPQDNQFGPKTS